MRLNLNPVDDDDVSFLVVLSSKGQGRIFRKLVLGRPREAGGMPRAFFFHVSTAFIHLFTHRGCGEGFIASRLFVCLFVWFFFLPGLFQIFRYPCS